MRLLWNGVRCSWPVSTELSCRSSRILGEKIVGHGRKRRRRGSTQVVEEVSTLGRAARCQREEGGHITATAQAWRGVVASRRCSRPDQRCRVSFWHPNVFGVGRRHPPGGITPCGERESTALSCTHCYFLMSCGTSGEQIQSPGEQLQLRRRRTPFRTAGPMRAARPLAPWELVANVSHREATLPPFCVNI